MTMMVSNMDEPQQLQNETEVAHPYIGGEFINPHSSLSQSLQADSTTYSGNHLAPQSINAALTKESPPTQDLAKIRKFKVSSKARKAAWAIGGAGAAVLTAYIIEQSSVKRYMRDLKRGPTSGTIPLTGVAPPPAVM